jgi:hypothetical protein
MTQERGGEASARQTAPTCIALPFSNAGNSPATTSSGAGSATQASAGSRDLEISLYFPCRSGISARRRVCDRLRPPPSSLWLRRLSARTPASPEKARDSAGSWRSGPRVSEPETATSAPERGRRPRSSLLAVRPVRIRLPFVRSYRRFESDLSANQSASLGFAERGRESAGIFAPCRGLGPAGRTGDQPLAPRMPARAGIVSNGNRAVRPPTGRPPGVGHPRSTEQGRLPSWTAEPADTRTVRADASAGRVADLSRGCVRPAARQTRTANASAEAAAQNSVHLRPT